MQQVRELTLAGAFVHVMVPAADVGERYFHTKICLQELRDLAQAGLPLNEPALNSGRRDAPDAEDHEHRRQQQNYRRQDPNNMIDEVVAWGKALKEVRSEKAISTSLSES